MLNMISHMVEDDTWRTWKTHCSNLPRRRSLFLFTNEKWQHQGSQHRAAAHRSPHKRLRIRMPRPSLDFTFLNNLTFYNVLCITDRVWCCSTQGMTCFQNTEKEMLIIQVTPSYSAVNTTKRAWAWSTKLPCKHLHKIVNIRKTIKNIEL